MLEASLSPRHSRRRSMPASFNAFAQDAPSPKHAASPTNRGNTSEEAVLDRLSISNNWARFESQLNEKKLRAHLNRKEESVWRRNFGLIGGPFWGYTSPDAEEAFFKSRLVQKTPLVKGFLACLLVLQVIELAFSYTGNWMYEICLVAIDLTAVFFYFFAKGRFHSESTVTTFIILLGLLEALHNPTFRHLDERNPGKISAMFSPTGIGGFSRRWYFLTIFVLLAACQFILGIRPSRTAAVMFFLAAFSHIPTFVLFVPYVASSGELELLFAVLGPITLLIWVGMFVGVMYQHFERVDFERSVLRFDMEERVELVRRSAVQSHAAPGTATGNNNASLTSLDGHGGSGGTHRTNSNGSLPTGSVESLSSMVQESAVDKRIRAFQQIQKEYSIRRHPTMQTLIDICVSAMALNVRQATGSDPNWSEFFSEQEHVSSTSKHSIAKPRRTSPSSSPVRRRRRHSVVVVEPLAGAQPPDSVPPTLTSLEELTPRLLTPRRSSSADNVSSAGVSTPLADFASGMALEEVTTHTTSSALGEKEDEEVEARLAELEWTMKDWNFGSSTGMWSALFAGGPSLRGPLYVDPLCAVTMQALSSLGVLDSTELLVDESALRGFVIALERAYLPRHEVAYHNSLHACDVVHTVFAMLHLDTVHIPEIALLGIVLAAAGHDVAHPGVNNAHLVTTRSPMAITYNDRSVLESFHVAKFFTIMRSDPRLDFLATARARNPQLAKTFRALVVDMILATDLKFHLDQQAKLRIFLAERLALASSSLRSASSSSMVPRGGGGSDRLSMRVSGEDESETDVSERTLTVPAQDESAHSTSSKDGLFDVREPAEVSLLCSTLLHAADISNVAKSWGSYKPWMDLLFEEFFAQGDLEKRLGLEVQQMMDRHACDPAQAQISFITGLVMPLYQVLEPILPISSGLGLVEMDRNVSMLRRLLRSPANSGASVLEAVDDYDDEDGGAERKKDQ